jgi:serine/threonine protein kinase
MKGMLTYSKAKNYVGKKIKLPHTDKTIIVGRYLDRGAEAFIFYCDLDGDNSLYKNQLVAKFYQHNVDGREDRADELQSTLKNEGSVEQLYGLPKYCSEDVEVDGEKVTLEIANNLNHEGKLLEDVLNPKDDKGTDLNLEERSSLARSLCDYVELMERKKIVHGDLSLKNIFISREGKRSAVMPIDYGNYHLNDGANLLPMRIKGRPTVRPRGQGAIGFQYPELLSPSNDSKGSYVKTDRFAMACLVIQMMIWKSYHEADLKRGELLRSDFIEDRSLENLELRLKNKWPEAVNALEAMLNSETDKLISPKEWVTLINDFQSKYSKKERKPYIGKPIILISQRDGNDVRYRTYTEPIKFNISDGTTELSASKKFNLKGVYMNSDGSNITISVGNKYQKVRINYSDVHYDDAIELTRAERKKIQVHMKMTIFIDRFRLTFNEI